MQTANETLQKTSDAQLFIQSSIFSILTMSKRVAATLTSAPAMINSFTQIIELIDSASEYYKDAFGAYRFDEIARIKKGFKIMRNHCTSMIDHVESHELTKKDLRQFSEKQESRCVKINKLISSVSSKVLEKRESKLEVVASSEQQDTAPNEKEDTDVKVLSGSKPLDEILKESAPLIKDLQKFAVQLPTAEDKKKPFIIKRFPIIPILANILSEEELQTAGFKTRKVGNYVVLMDQLVVGENTNVLAQRSWTKVRDEENKRKKVLQYVKDKEDMPDIEEVISAIEQKLGKKLINVSKQKVPSQHGFKWYWLVEEKKISAVNRKNKHFNVRDWSFAFNR